MDVAEMKILMHIIQYLLIMDLIEQRGLSVRFWTECLNIADIGADDKMMHQDDLESDYKKEKNLGLNILSEFGARAKPSLWRSPNYLLGSCQVKSGPTATRMGKPFTPNGPGESDSSLGPY
jgi:hypothetical protein